MNPFQKLIMGGYTPPIPREGSAPRWAERAARAKSKIPGGDPRSPASGKSANAL